MLASVAHLNDIIQPIYALTNTQQNQLFFDRNSETGDTNATAAASGGFDTKVDTLEGTLTFYMKSASALAEEQTADLSSTNTHFELVEWMATQPLQTGLQQSAMLYYTDAKQHQSSIDTLIAFTFIAFLALMAYVQLFVIKTLSANVRNNLQRLIAMLGSLPVRTDVFERIERVALAE